jgi:hypothetical protein
LLKDGEENDHNIGFQKNANIYANIYANIGKNRPK